MGALSPQSDPWSGRQQRHLLFIAEFSPTIRHIASQSNVVVDTLSRPASGATFAPIRCAALYSLWRHQGGGDCQQGASSSALRVTTIKMDNTSIMVDTSSGVFRPLIPAAFRCPIFDAIHSGAHPGIRATRRPLTDHLRQAGVVHLFSMDSLHLPPWDQEQAHYAIPPSGQIRLVSCFAKNFFSLYVFAEPAVSFCNFFLCCPSQRSACSQVPSQGGNPPEDWQSAVGWGDARFEPGTAGQQSGSLPLSYHASSFCKMGET